MRRGQAMVETVIAVLILTSIFLCLFRLSQVLTAKIAVEHAAMRVARGRAVGMNRFMCLKNGRVGVIVAAGKRTVPSDANAIDDDELPFRIPIYMQADTPPKAAGVLEYEKWGQFKFDGDDCTKSTVDFADELLGNEFTVKGEAGIEHNADFYMDDSGL